MTIFTCIIVNKVYGGGENNVITYKHNKSNNSNDFIIIYY